MAQGKIGNLTIVAGRAVKDAELKHVGDKGTALCEFGLAVDKKSDNQTVFANCKAWRELGEYASLISKGDSVAVIGTIEEREYNGKTYKNIVADWLNVVKLSKGVPDHSSSTFEELGDSDGELPFD